ncbi:hypothetical protein [Butyrivibrio sp. NC2007]|uniref:hypothetical protein n=2 Tax=Butyrivibrio sp. NC2007 TaxID=1280683 RepID=UPI0003B54CF9|nr:hypothetical protein [Butyrivibrio sp. NC2007]
MNINEFIEKYNIAIVAEADIENKRFEIIKRDKELESYDLFEQLILFGNVKSLVENVEGQILPRIWTQGKSKCILCQKAEGQVVALFYDCEMDAKEHYLYAKELDAIIKDIQC